MLVATVAGVSVDAASVRKGAEYVCPQCKCGVVLKKGRIVIHHFAHKAKAACNYANGETYEHLSGKAAFRDSLRSRGLIADVERAVLSSGGDRRADVLLEGPPPHHRQVALELQHQSIGLDEIERRTSAYMDVGIPVVWIPFLRPSVWDDADDGDEENECDFYIKRYSAPPWQRWLSGYMGERPVWFYEAAKSVLWKAKLAPCKLYAPLETYYDEWGDDYEKGGYWYEAKRWMTLHLWGPTALADVRIAKWNRSPQRTSDYFFPGGRAAGFVVPAPQ